MVCIELFYSWLRAKGDIILGPLEMREVIRHHAEIGVDQVKLSMSGEEVRSNHISSPSALSDTRLMIGY